MTAKSTASRTDEPELGSTSPPISSARLLASYALAIGDRSPATRDRVYLPAVRQLARYLEEIGHSGRVGAIRREHVEAFLADLREREGRRGQPMSPATVSKVYRSLRPFFAWLVEEDEIAADPMAKIRRPRVPETHKTPITEAEYARLLATVAGKTFEERRDNAIIRLLGSTGMRRGELEGLDVEAVMLDSDGGSVFIRAGSSKSRRDRIPDFGRYTALALDRYLRMRDAHPLADVPRNPRAPKEEQRHPLWLGTRNRGPLRGNGLLLMLRRRGRTAGIPNLHPHLFRHTYANDFLASGGSEGDLMELAGWRDRSMVAHYSRGLASTRARAAGRRLDPMEGR